MTVENAKSFVKHLVEDGNEPTHEHLSKIGTEFTKEHMAQALKEMGTSREDLLKQATGGMGKSTKEGIVYGAAGVGVVGGTYCAAAAA